MAHVSRWVPPGAVRLGSAVARAPGGPASPLVAAAVAAPGGATVAVVMNPGDGPEHVTLADERFGYAGVDLPPHSIVTWQH